MMISSEKVEMLDLAVLTDNGKVHNLMGKPWGSRVREDFKLAELDNADHPIDVRVPDHIYSISPSFFLGAFSGSLDELGSREGFLKHYRFRCDEVIMKQIEESIEDWKARRLSKAAFAQAAASAG